MVEKKKAQSQIIGAILLILLVIISAMVIMGFVIPFVRDKLSGAECLDVSGKIIIKNNPIYTCYNPATTDMRIQIHIGDIENLIKGFQINIESGGSASSVEVITGTTDVSMYGGGTVEVPGRNEERTYVISGVNNFPDSVSVYPVLNDDRTCGVSDVLNSVASC